MVIYHFFTSKVIKEKIVTIFYNHKISEENNNPVASFIIYQSIVPSRSQLVWVPFATGISSSKSRVFCQISGLCIFERIFLWHILLWYFRFLYLGETFSPVQLVGAIITVAAIYMVNFRNTSEWAGSFKLLTPWKNCNELKMGMLEASLDTERWNLRDIRSWALAIMLDSANKILIIDEKEKIRLRASS